MAFGLKSATMFQVGVPGATSKRNLQGIEFEFSRLITDVDLPLFDFTSQFWTDVIADQIMGDRAKTFQSKLRSISEKIVNIATVGVFGDAGFLSQAASGTGPTFKVLNSGTYPVHKPWIQLTSNNTIGLSIKVTLILSLKPETQAIDFN